jgi:hypothetical protein
MTEGVFDGGVCGGMLVFEDKVCTKELVDW